MTTAEELHREADRQQAAGASEVAVQILRRAAEFAAKQFAPQTYTHWADDAREDVD